MGSNIVAAAMNTAVGIGQAEFLPRRRNAVRALFASDPTLRGAIVSEEPPSLEELSSMARNAPEWMRRRAFVLGLEILVCGNQSNLDVQGPTFRAIGELAGALQVLDEDFCVATLFPLRCKHIAGDVSDEVAEVMVAAMLSVGQGELATIQQIIALVPQLASRDREDLISRAAASLTTFSALLDRLGKLTSFRDKTYVLASEVAHASGLSNETEVRLNAIATAMPITAKLPANARILHAARFADRSTETVTALVAKLAGFAAAHAVLSIESGPLTPMLVFEALGKRTLTRFAGDDLGSTANQARAAFQSDWSPEQERAVVVVDGYITLEGVKHDALLVDAADRARGAASEAISFSMAIPYRPVTDSTPFAIHKPKLVALSPMTLDTTALIEAFWAGVDTHTKGAKFWTEHLDQSV
ncbi:MAG: hypothetical protein U0271_00025 [Polyangiaceae bacterium]